MKFQSPKTENRFADANLNFDEFLGDQTSDQTKIVFGTWVLDERKVLGLYSRPQRPKSKNRKF